MLGPVANSLVRWQVPKSLKIEMTDRDRGRVRAMLDREDFAAPARAFWKEQLQQLLMWDCKYEIEALNAVHRSGSDPLGCACASAATCKLHLILKAHRSVPMHFRFFSGTFIHDKISRSAYFCDL